MAHFLLISDTERQPCDCPIGADHVAPIQLRDARDDDQIEDTIADRPDVITGSAESSEVLGDE